MRYYTKTGKKVKSIYDGRDDLTYNEVYDVFIDDKGDEFIIDDVGDKRYWSIFDDDYYELVDDDYISAFTDNVKVGYIGIINLVDNDDNFNPYRVKFDELDVRNEWWFTDKRIELVSDNTNNIENENSPIKSDGGSSSYYAQQIPKGMLERFNTTGVIEAKDVIRLFLGNDFNMGNIFKAYCRVISLRNGKGKAGIDEQYDLTKAKYFTEDELNYYLENKDV